MTKKISANITSIMTEKPVLRTWTRITGNLTAKNVTLVAGGVAFYAFLSIFPAIVCLLMVWGLFTDVSELNDSFSFLKGTVPPPAYALITEQMTRIADRNSDVSIWAAIVSLLLALWSASRAVNALLMAMQSMYNLKKKPNFFKAKIIALLFTLSGVVFAVASIALIGAIPPILEALRLGAVTEALILTFRWIFIVGIFFLGGVMFYRVSRRDPDRVKHAKRNQVIPGAITASVIWLISSFAFSFYLSAFETYNETFGSLGAVAALLMWLWLSALALLIGAEVNTDFDGKEDRKRDAIIPTA